MASDGLITERSSSAWMVAGGVVVLAWSVGYLVWGIPASGFRDRARTDDLVPLMMIGIPGGVAAGVLRASRDRGFRRIGTVLLALVTLLIAAIAAWSFFGGICLDAEDECRTTWGSRFATLGLGVVVLAVGAAAELLLHHRTERS